MYTYVWIIGLAVWLWSLRLWHRSSGLYRNEPCHISNLYPLTFNWIVFFLQKHFNRHNSLCFCFSSIFSLVHTNNCVSVPVYWKVQFLTVSVYGENIRTFNVHSIGMNNWICYGQLDYYVLTEFELYHYKVNVRGMFDWIIDWSLGSEIWYIVFWTPTPKFC